jgi:hypothetical protein
LQRTISPALPYQIALPPGDAAFSSNYKLTSVTLPANVEIGIYGLPCREAYEANGRRAGTYIFSKWTVWKLR